MSDRFVLQGSKQEVEQTFEVSTKREDYFESDFNITPGSLIPVVYEEGGERDISNFIWGLIPKGAEVEKEGIEHFEVPLEDIEENEWFSECLEQRRCLIPANGFYKWKTTKKKSTPFYIRLLNNNLLAFAGIYSIWKSQTGRSVYSCAMLTRAANPLIQPVDKRMPLIIHPDDYRQWLSEVPAGDLDFDKLKHSYTMTEMAVNRVSEDVNNPDNNSEELIQPIPK